MKATFKFRGRGTTKLPGKRHGAKTSILSIRAADTGRGSRRVAWNAGCNSYEIHRQLAGKSRLRDEPSNRSSRIYALGCRKTPHGRLSPFHTCANGYATSLRRALLSLRLTCSLSLSLSLSLSTLGGLSCVEWNEDSFCIESN